MRKLITAVINFPYANVAPLIDTDKVSKFIPANDPSNGEMMSETNEETIA